MALSPLEKPLVTEEGTEIYWWDTLANAIVLLGQSKSCHTDKLTQTFTLIHMHIRMHAYTHAHTYTHTYACMHAHSHTNTHICMHAHAHTNAHTHTHIQTHTHAHLSTLPCWTAQEQARWHQGEYPQNPG